MKTKYLLIGTLPPPKGGQAAITKFVTQIHDFDLIIDTTKRSFYFFTDFLIFLVKSFKYRFTHTHIYTAISRGKLSVLRELLLIVFINPTRCVNHLHGNDFEWIFSSRVYAKLIKYLYKKHVSLTICVNKYQCDFLDKWNIKNVLLTNPIVDAYDKNYIACNNINFNIERDYTFGYISFVMSSKGIFTVLEEFKKLLLDRPLSKLLIAGEIKGDDKLDFKSTYDKFYLTVNMLNKTNPGCVKYLGHVDGIEKIKFYTSIKYLLFLSRFKSESFGLVLIEAMDLGAMPVINDNPILKDTLKAFTYEELSISNSLSKLYDSNIEHRKLIKNSDIVKLIYYPENFKNKILNYL